MGRLRKPIPRTPFEEFAARLESYVLAAGFRRADGSADREAFAQAVNRARATIDRWLSGSMFPEDSLEEISRVVDRSLSELRYGVPSMGGQSVKPRLPHRPARHRRPSAGKSRPWPSVDPEVQALIFPVVTALAEMFRAAHATGEFRPLEHLLKQIAFLMNPNLKPHQALTPMMAALAKIKAERN